MICLLNKVRILLQSAAETEEDKIARCEKFSQKAVTLISVLVSSRYLFRFEKTVVVTFLLSGGMTVNLTCR